jgi:predicted NUDIX family NTP pyrophosphohydrolase
VHSRGPHWSRKNEGAWTIPKGEYEEPLAAAQREFTEKTSFIARDPFLELGSVRQKGGETFAAWAIRARSSGPLVSIDAS